MNNEMAVEFLSALSGDEESPSFSFQTFADHEADKKDKAKRRKLTKVYHGGLTAFEPNLQKLNEARAGIFVTVNRTNGQGRTAGDVVALRALFVDCDDPSAAKDPYAEVAGIGPSFLVTTPNGWHAYWLLKPGEDLTRFRAAQKHLIRWWKTDDSIHDLPRVMRIPGFFHRKEKAEMVAMEMRDSERRYTIDEILFAHQLSEEEAAETETEDQLPPQAPADLKDRSKQNDLVKRATAYLARIPGGTAKDRRGEGRNTPTFGAACVGGDFDLQPEDFWPLLCDWNARSNTPPYDDKKLREILDHSVRYRRDGVGSRAEDRPAPGRRHQEYEQPPEPARARKKKPPPEPEPSAPPPTDPPAGDDDVGSDDIPEKYTTVSDGGVKLSANDMARRLMHLHDLACDRHGFVYEHNGEQWNEHTNATLNSLALTMDTHQHTSQNRRKEAINYALASAQVGTIRWNQVKESEVPLADGVIDTLSGIMRPHRRGDWLNRICPHTTHAEATCPRWFEALGEWFDGDPEQVIKIKALQEFAGYILLPRAHYKKALFMLGETDCGKSVVVGVLQALVGAGNHCAVTVEDMGDPRKVAPLRGKALNIMSELKAQALIADGGFKTLVSTGEPVLVDQKFKDAVMEEITAKHVFACNTLPRVRDRTSATFNRLLVIRFPNEIHKEAQDPSLGAKLQAEIPGIILWALQGARRLVAAGGRFTTVEDSDRLVDELRDDSNQVAAFMDEETMHCDHGGSMKIGKLLMKYREWSGDRNIDRRDFGQGLKSAGYFEPNRQRLRTVHNRKFKEIIDELD